MAADELWVHPPRTPRDRYATCRPDCTTDCGHCKGRRFGPYADGNETPTAGSALTEGDRADWQHTLSQDSRVTLTLVVEFDALMWAGASDELRARWINNAVDVLTCSRIGGAVTVEAVS